MFRPGRHDAQRLIIITLAMFVIVTGLATARTASAQAEAPVRLSITPVDSDGIYFDLTLEPGETRELSVLLTNNGSTAIVARTYPTDAYTIVNGGFGARNADEPTSGATHWINYGNETLELEPEETVTRTFTLSVPEDAEPGQHLTSLVIENAEPVGNNTGGGVGFNQIIRQIIAVAVTIPGPNAPALQFGQASHAMVAGKSTIRIEVMNTGNVHLVPYGEITLTDSKGAEVARVPIKMAIVYSGTDTLVDTGLPTLLEAGDYTATLTLQEDKYGTHAESGPLPLSIPMLVAPQPVRDTATAADPAAAPVVEVQTTGIPAWALLVAVPAAIVLGVLIALVVLGMRRRPKPAAEMLQPVLVVAAPPVARTRPAIVRQMTPPSREV